MTEQSHFEKLAAINVNDKLEKKNGLSYLSWAWAVDQLMRYDPAANWTFNEPTMFGDTMMVSCTVTAFGKSVTMHLPVMDHRNKAIHNPDAFDVNKNMMRCLVKAIACHGLGLYVYAGEDLPLEEDETAAWAEEIAMPVRSMFARGDIAGAAHALNTLGTNSEYDAEAKEAVWSRLESNIRSTIKGYESLANAKNKDQLTAAWKATPKHAHPMLEAFAVKRASELEPKPTEEKEAA